jgi:hypothetical protein
MNDPTSIVATSAPLVMACGKISQYISTKLLEKVADLDPTILLLRIELDSLGAAVGFISLKFSQTPTTPFPLQPELTGYEDEYWGNVKRSMGDCRATLTTLEQVIQSVKRSDRLFMKGATIETRLERKLGEIAALRQQIVAYHKTMELSLQLITVFYHLPRSASDIVRRSCEAEA